MQLNESLHADFNEDFCGSMVNFLCAFLILVFFSVSCLGGAKN